MQAIFIKETNITNFKEKCLLIIKRILNRINIIEENNNKILVLPITKKTKCNKKLIGRLEKRIVKFLEIEGTNCAVLSEELKKIDILKNKLYSQNINILAGRYLFKILSIKVIKYILELKNKKIESSEIYICINEINGINEKLIIDIAKRVKTLNIITNRINKFKKIEKYLYEEFGIALNISNNKKTSLLKSKIILNFDFPEEVLNQYRINTNSIIINFMEKIDIISKKFNGINVNNYKINISNNYKINGFKNEEVYESIIYNYNYKQVQKELEKDELKINSLIGNRGEISKQEFIRISY